MFKFTQKLLSICPVAQITANSVSYQSYQTYPNLKKQYLLYLLNNYNTYLYSELNKTNCDIQKFFITQDLTSVNFIKDKIDSDNIKDEDVNKNIKIVLNKYNSVQYKYN